MSNKHSEEVLAHARDVIAADHAGSKTERLQAMANNADSKLVLIKHNTVIQILAAVSSVGFSALAGYNVVEYQSLGLELEHSNSVLYVLIVAMIGLIVMINRRKGTISAELKITCMKMMAEIERLEQINILPDKQ